MKVIAKKSKYLTEGKEYKVFSTWSSYDETNYIKVIDDKGIFRSYSEKFFLSKAEIREIKLNELL